MQTESDVSDAGLTLPEIEFAEAYSTDDDEESRSPSLLDIVDDSGVYNDNTTKADTATKKPVDTVVKDDASSTSYSSTDVLPGKVKSEFGELKDKPKGKWLKQESQFGFPVALSQITDAESAEIASLVAAVRLSGLPLVDFASQVGALTNKPTRFYAYFDRNDLLDMAKLAETDQVDNSLEKLIDDLTSSFARKKYDVSNYMRRILQLLLTEEMRRVLAKRSMAPTTVTVLKDVAVNMNVTLPEETSTTFEAVIFRDVFYQSVAMAFEEVQKKIPNVWNSVAELCHNSTASQHFAKYLVESMKPMTGKETGHVFAVHWGLMDAEIGNLIACCAGAKAVISRMTPISTTSSKQSSVKQPTFYGNELRVWNKIVAEMGPDRALQYQSFVKEYAAVNLIPEEQL